MSTSNIVKLVAAGALVVIGFVVFKKALGILIPVAILGFGGYAAFRYFSKK